MATVDSIPTRDEVRQILTAAADVLFSDGVAEEFLDQWADETVFMLSLGPVPHTARPTHRSG
jgi:hypothetical protein